MIKYKLITLLLLFSFLSSIAQDKEKIKGDRNVTISETKIDGFNRIVVADDFKVDLIEGSEAKVFLETDSNLHDVITFTVVDSTLSFNTTHKITSSKEMSIKVTYTKALEYIETQESGEVSSLTSINVKNVQLVNTGNSRAFLNIRTNKFRLINSDRAKTKLNVTTKEASLNISDNANVETLINADSLQVDLYQRSEAELEGDVKYLNVRADNSSNFKGKNLTSVTADVISEINCDVYVQATDNITIEASGTSEVYIYADPKITLTKFSENAKLHKKELN